MKKVAAAALVVMLAGAFELRAEDAPQTPTPQKEHEWLQQFVGEWESEVEVTFDLDQPPMKLQGTESVRMIGGFWIVAEGESEMMGTPFRHVLTLGYAPETQKYVGTWVDSMSSYLWKYEGTVDESGAVLTLQTEGPCHLSGGRLSKFKEVTEFKSPDHRVFTASVQGEDGEWTTLITGHSRRK